MGSGRRRGRERGLFPFSGGRQEREEAGLKWASVVGWAGLAVW